MMIIRFKRQKMIDKWVRHTLRKRFKNLQGKIVNTGDYQLQGPNYPSLFCSGMRPNN